jgi:hypothetical protein
MTDDDLDRIGVELHRRVDVLIEARRALAAAQASCDADAISQAEEAAWQAGLALAVPALDDMARNRMAREIEHLDNKPNDPATNHRRGLLMQGRFLIDMRPFGRADVTDVFAGDALRQLNGEDGQLSRPVDTGPGQKGFNPIDLNLIRRFVLRVIVESRRTEKTRERFLNKLPKGPTYAQFREWSQRVALEERETAKKIGKALSAGRPLPSNQAALWAEIEDDDLGKMFGYVQGLDPAARRA